MNSPWFIVSGASKEYSEVKHRITGHVHARFYDDQYCRTPTAKEMAQKFCEIMNGEPGNKEAGK
jgi:hypothetical protein